MRHVEEGNSACAAFLCADNPNIRRTSLFVSILSGDVKGAYSRRINILYRLVYEVLEKERTVKVLHMRTHYE